MVKVGYGGPVGRAAPITAPPVATPGDKAAQAARAADSVTIGGLNEADLTPKVRSAMLSLLGEVDRLRMELDVARRRNDQLERLADEDSLLPVVNRRAFVRELARMIAFARRHRASSTLIYFDVNDMKQVNDSHGHAAGDAVLYHVAETLARSVRQSDVVGRLGGDEFGVLLAQAGPEAGAAKARFLADAVAAKPVLTENRAITTTLAFGTYTFTGDEAVDAALERADQAMYAQKRETRAGR